TTTTTTTTTGCDICTTSYAWNQTGTIVADTSSNPISEARCVYFKGNNTIYLCGHRVGHVEQWIVNAASRTVVTSNTVDRIDYISFDKDGTMYTNNNNNNFVQSFVSSSLTGTIIVLISDVKREILIDSSTCWMA
ncbi:unnamed protein product, partial [Rotaria sp. Silwood2]